MILAGRNIEKGGVYVHYAVEAIGITLLLTEAEAINLADELVAQVDALNMEKVLDEC